MTHIPRLSNPCKLLKISHMVEAAGVEPASENVTGEEPTCLFQFKPQALGSAAFDGRASPRTFAPPAQNGQETGTASL